MPVDFLSKNQRESYGCYNGAPSPEELSRYFHLDDADLFRIAQKRGNHNRFGFALQLGTVRYLGTFLDDYLVVPSSVIAVIAKQLYIAETIDLQAYSVGAQRRQHAIEIRNHFHYVEIADQQIGFRLTRWLYALCWTGTDRPGILFERAITWLVTHKVLLPGCSILERHVARLRSRVEERLWRLLGCGISDEQRVNLEYLLVVPIGSRVSQLDKLRTGPVRVSTPSLVFALRRLNSVRELSIKLPAMAHIPATRIAALARFAGVAKASAILRLPKSRRLATLVAFVHCLEASAQDDVLEVLEALLRELFSNAVKADKKSRLRTLKDLDLAASTLASACQILLDTSFSDNELRIRLFEKISRDTLTDALDDVNALIRPSDNVYYQELNAKYKTVSRFLPTLLEHISFGASITGKSVVAAFEWLKINFRKKETSDNLPREIINKAWIGHVLREDGSVDIHAYTFCVLEQLQTALKRREVFVSPSWRYADPRAGLLDGIEWESTRPIICRTLGLSINPEPTLDALTLELDQTYRAVAERLPNNPHVRFDTSDGKHDLVLSSLDKVEEPASLVLLREKVISMLPCVDLPELILEIATRTGFVEAFTHVSESTARATDLHISICAALMAEACNTGLEPLIRDDIPALKRDRLSWVNQNYVRDDTLTAANTVLVAAQSHIALASLWGGGEVARWRGGFG